MDLHVCELGKVNDIPKVAKAIKGFLGSVAPTVNVTTKTSHCSRTNVCYLHSTIRPSGVRSRSRGALLTDVTIHTHHPTKGLTLACDGHMTTVLMLSVVLATEFKREHDMRRPQTSHSMSCG